jgi:hypothetical protein
MDICNLARFIAEDKNIDPTSAKKLADFFEKVKHIKAVVNPVIYCDHGKARVYFDLWSQNNLPAMEGLYRSYYDAEKDTVILVRKLCSFYYDDIKDIKFHCRGLFSGAKTREALRELRDVL